MQSRFARELSRIRANFSWLLCVRSFCVCVCVCPINWRAHRHTHTLAVEQKFTHKRAYTSRPDGQSCGPRDARAGRNDRCTLTSGPFAIRRRIPSVLQFAGQNDLVLRTSDGGDDGSEDLLEELLPSPRFPPPSGGRRLCEACEGEATG